MFVRVPFFPGISSLFTTIASSRQPECSANVRLVERGVGGGGQVHGEGAVFGQILNLATLAVRIRNPIGVID